MTKFTFLSYKGTRVTVSADDEAAARTKAMIELHGPPRPFGRSTTDPSAPACAPAEWRGLGLLLMSNER